jgi:tetratricopeptide (TPR) repeat protein
MITYVIARYKEDIGWVNDLPADAEIYLYNKGPEIDPASITRPVHLKQLKNTGRESATYLHYLLHDYKPGESDFVVFTQGEPFEHAPDFLELMKVSDKWRDIQPLSLLWLADKKTPPLPVLEVERSDWIGSLAVRAEHFSLKTWAPVAFFDEGAWGIGNTYRQKHMLPNGVNVAAHFFEFCGFDDIAHRALESDVGVFSYGAIFAVRGTLVAKLVAEARQHLVKMELLARADLNYGYIFERIWLHLFGEPFVKFDAVKKPQAATVAAPAARDVVPPSRASVADIRQRAFAALAEGRIDDGRALLQKALFANPVDAEVLSDLAALAFQQGNHSMAIPYARRALAARPEHAISRFTLAMCLSASGQHDEAAKHLQAVTQGTLVDQLRAEAPGLVDVANSELARLQGLLVTSDASPLVEGR